MQCQIALPCPKPKGISQDQKRLECTGKDCSCLSVPLHFCCTFCSLGEDNSNGEDAVSNRLYNVLDQGNFSKPQTMASLCGLQRGETFLVCVCNLVRGNILIQEETTCCVCVCGGRLMIKMHFSLKHVICFLFTS